MSGFITKHRHQMIVVALLVLCLVVGAVQNMRLRHLRESESFYRWILAAAVNERLFQEESLVDMDAPLFSRCVAIAKQSPRFSEFQRDPDAEAPDGISLLGRVASDYQEDALVWEFARSAETSDVRRDFVRYARAQQLRFAQDIEYADAQAGGVNIFNLFFGFRKVAANFVWLEVDRYWHQGNMYRMITLMRTCVALDPQFIEAYLIGAWHLAYNATARMPDTPWPQREWLAEHEECVGEKERFYYHGVDFLSDGIRRNPRNYRLYFDLGFSIYKQKLEDYENAVKYLSEAVRLPHEQFVPRQLFLCLELNGQYEEALAGWKDYLERYPEGMIATDVAPRFIDRNRGMIYEQNYERLIRQKNQTDNPEEVARLKAEAEEYLEKARSVWAQLEDPYGEGRLLRMEALDLHDAGRHLEAIAFLDRARWDSSQLFHEFSDMIIGIKMEAGIPLTVSEKKAVLRETEVGVCAGMPIEEQERRLRAVEQIEEEFIYH